jgi:hypothetical protein
LLHQIEAAKALLQTGIIEVPGRVQPGIASRRILAELVS